MNFHHPLAIFYWLCYRERSAELIVNHQARAPVEQIRPSTRSYYMNVIDQLADLAVAPPAALFAAAIKFAWEYHLVTVIFAVVFWVGVNKVIGPLTDGTDPSGRN
jgi:hypothetical protein